MADIKTENADLYCLSDGLLCLGRHCLFAHSIGLHKPLSLCTRVEPPALGIRELRELLVKVISVGVYSWLSTCMLNGW